MTRMIWKYLEDFIDFLIFYNTFKRPRFRGIQKQFTFYWSIDLMFSILIIGVLVAIAIPRFVDYKKRAILIHAFGYKTVMEQCHVYHSLTGEWPDDEEKLGRFTCFNKLMKDYEQKYIESFQVDHGAVHLTYTDELDGKTLTLRPAVTGGDPLGPVIWVAGVNFSRRYWSVFGDDKTTVEPYMINRYLR